MTGNCNYNNPPSCPIQSVIGFIIDIVVAYSLPFLSVPVFLSHPRTDYGPGLRRIWWSPALPVGPVCSANRFAGECWKPSPRRGCCCIPGDGLSGPEAWIGFVVYWTTAVGKQENTCIRPYPAACTTQQCTTQCVLDWLGHLRMDNKMDRSSSPHHRNSNMTWHLFFICLEFYESRYRYWLLLLRSRRRRSVRPGRRALALWNLLILFHQICHFDPDNWSFFSLNSNYVRAPVLCQWECTIPLQKYKSCNILYEWV